MKGSNGKRSYLKTLGTFISAHIRDMGTVGFLLIFLIIMTFRHQEFFNLGALSESLNIHMAIMKQASIIAIVAATMTLVIISGGIDLSVGSLVIATAALAAGLTVHSGIPVILAFIAAVIFGAILGAVNGFLTAWVGIPPFIVTLGMMSLARGGAYLYCNAVSSGTTIFGLPPGARIFASSIPIGKIISVPFPFLFIILIFIIMHIVLSRTKLGRYTYAIGANETVAKLSGIDVNMILLFIYTLAGAFCALAGFIYIGELNSASAEGLIGFELDVIAAVVIGGTSLMGGEGKIFGSFVGAIFIAYIRDGLTREGAGTEWGMIVIGALILLAVGFDTFIKKGGYEKIVKLFKT